MSDVAFGPVNGIKMRYALSGPAGGPAVVLHHPLATNLTYWDELTASLNSTYRVLRFDARGHGQTEAPAGRYDFDNLSRDVVGLMDHVGIAKAAFIGLSMGGMVGQFLGGAFSDRFNSLMLVATTSRVAPEFKSLWRDRVVVAREKGMASQVDPAMARWVTEATRANNPALVARFKQMIEATPLEGYAGWCGAIENLDAGGQHAAIRLPTKIVSGALDPGTPPAVGEIIHKAIKGSEFVVLPGVAHMLSAENPAAFLAEVQPFLAANAR